MHSQHHVATLNIDVACYPGQDIAGLETLGGVGLLFNACQMEEAGLVVA